MIINAFGTKKVQVHLRQLFEELASLPIVLLLLIGEHEGDGCIISCSHCFTVTHF